MKTRSYLMAAALAAVLWRPMGGVAAERISDAAREARLMLADMDQEILTEQYRHVRMELFKARLDLKMTQIKLRHAPEEKRNSDGAESMTAAMEERALMLDRMVEEIRERIIRVHMERAELEAASVARGGGEAREQPAHPFNGEWIGKERGRGTIIQLRVDGPHARLEAPQEEHWYEGELVVEPKGEAMWEVQFRVERCSHPEYEGKTSLGLARMEEDRLVLAANKPGDPERPSSLEPTDETRVFVFERE